MLMPVSMITCAPHTLAIFGLPGGGEWIVLLVLGLLIFGRRLPEVGRSLGRGIVEFKKGIKGVEDEVDEEASRPAKRMTDQPRSELPKSRAREEMADEHAEEKEVARKD